MTAPEPPTEIVHACPLGDEGTTPCCGVTPFELPPWASRITTEPALVTCTGGLVPNTGQAREPGVPQTFGYVLGRVSGGVRRVEFWDDEVHSTVAEVEAHARREGDPVGHEPLALVQVSGTDQLGRTVDEPPGDTVPTGQDRELLRRAADALRAVGKAALTVKGTLAQPYTAAPETSPWKQFMEKPAREAYNLGVEIRRALAAAPSGDTASASAAPCPQHPPIPGHGDELIAVPGFGCPTCHKESK